MRNLIQSRFVGLLKLMFLAATSSSDGFAAKNPCQLCYCVDSWAGESVTCTNRNLSTVPRGFPATSYVLRLDRNNLTKISRGDFWNLRRVTEL
ncbi:leucine-rich repeat-containing protein 3-like [Orbicella faveolata]|uniref:leucine-rich repeat-containing protein 3-like n=1 Tax=Orbicella faveolata TaxID=48498 RepID=UPI0009E1E0A5|nr:leucine-rich repeat-containing protein 3-like [Orbicella faveolata]